VQYNVAKTVAQNTKTPGKSHALAVGCSDKNSGKGRRRIDMNKELIERLRDYVCPLKNEAADLIEVQAVKIAELEKEVSETYHAQAHLQGEVLAACAERDTLRSKLDALEAQEPVATIANASGGFRIDNHAPDILEAGMKLYLAAKPTVRELSNYEICAIAKETESAEPGRDGYILPVTFARAVLAARSAT
jgi:hypothetical protein